jgi:hypothetical protein
MNRLTASLAIACGAALFATTANAETVDELKRELAAKKAYIAKLERRLRDLEKHPPAPKPTLVTAPVAPPLPRVPVAAAPPASPEDEEMERALERTLVREGALVLPPWTFELTPQFSYAHWDSVQDPFIRNSYSAGLSFRMGLPWTSQGTVSLPYVWNEGRDPFPSSDGPTVFKQACKLGLEGIVSKRLGSPYVSGRSRHWIKNKNPQHRAVKREAEEEEEEDWSKRRWK